MMKVVGGKKGLNNRYLFPLEEKKIKSVKMLCQILLSMSPHSAASAQKTWLPAIVGGAERRLARRFVGWEAWKHFWYERRCSGGQGQQE